MKKVMFLLPLILTCASVCAKEVGKEMKVNNVKYACYIDNGEQDNFKKDYKQCVIAGDWRLPNITGMHHDSYRYACEKFSMTLNCHKVKK